MKTRLTRESARAARACYSDDRIACLVPPLGLTPAQVARLPIDPLDRYWALVKACGATRETRWGAAEWCSNASHGLSARACFAMPMNGAVCAFYEGVPWDEILADMVGRLERQGAETVVSPAWLDEIEARLEEDSVECVEAGL
jgi:hypothetical protein